MKRLFIALITLTSTSLFAQEDSNYLGNMMVIDSKGVTLRSEPSIEAKKIVSLGFGQTIEAYKFSRTDTVNSMIDRWVGVIHQNDTGYVFRPYLSHTIQINNLNFGEISPQFFKEKRACGEKLFFNPRLNWFGVYQNEYNERRYEFKKVSINFNVSFENYEFNLSHEISPAYLKITVDDPRKSLLLFGINDSIPDRRIRILPNPVKHIPSGFASFNSIYPGESISLGYNKATKKIYTLECYGTVSSDSFKKKLNGRKHKFKNYEVKIRIKDKEDERFQILKIQPEDEIQFIGDLNNDNINDLIIFQRLGHAATSTYLLLSGYGEQPFTKVAENYCESCH